MLPFRGAVGLALVLAASSCSDEASRPDIATPVRPDTTRSALPPDTVDVRGVARALATIEPVGRGRAEGTVRLTETGAGVRVRADLTGLSRQDFHALQVLRGRDCDADPAIHLGADDGTPHGGPYSLPGQRHAGDLGSVRSDGGRGLYDRIDPVLSLSGTASAVGRAVVVRAGRDDAASPDGAAGDVIGCGVLEPGR